MKISIYNNLKSKLTNTPKSFYILCCTETCELFGRFGVSALLILYLTKTLHYSDAKAFMIFGSFFSLLFVTPLIGGILCDRYLGKIKSIIIGGTIMGIGNLILALNNSSLVCLWPGYNHRRQRSFLT